MADTPKGTHLYNPPQGGRPMIVIERSKDAVDPTNAAAVAEHYKGIVADAIKYRVENGVGLATEMAVHPASHFVSRFIFDEVGGTANPSVTEAVRFGAHEQLERYREGAERGKGVTLSFNNIATKRGEVANCEVKIDASALAISQSRLPASGPEQISLPSPGYGGSDFGVFSSGNEISVKKHKGVTINCTTGR